MPFKSQAQQRFMFSKHPEIANKWAHELGPQKGLPEKVKSKLPDKKSAWLSMTIEQPKTLEKENK